MRPTRLWLLLLVAAMSGCAGLDSGGYGENYNGFPLPWLLTKAPPQSRTDAMIQQPQFSPTGRFARQPGYSADSASSEKTSSEQAPSEQTPPAE